jgi:hypothetical protein
MQRRRALSQDVTVVLTQRVKHCFSSLAQRLHAYPFCGFDAGCFEVPSDGLVFLEFWIRVNDYDHHDYMF